MLSLMRPATIFKRIKNIQPDRLVLERFVGLPADMGKMKIAGNSLL